VLSSHYVLLQGSKGAAAGFVVGLTGIWLASRRFSAFRQMPIPFKGFLLSGVTAGTSVTVADRASLAFERRKYGGLEQAKVALSKDSDWKHRVIFLDVLRLTLTGPVVDKPKSMEVDCWILGRESCRKLVYY